MAEVINGFIIKLIKRYMSGHTSYITLDSIVLDYLNEANLSNNQYFRIWHIAYRGFEDLGLDAFYKVQSVKLPINANLTVTLPADFINWAKCGVLNDRGEVIPLNYNEKLTTYADLLPDRLEKTQDDTLGTNGWGDGCWYNYWNGYAYTNIYGVPSGSPFVGSFKVDTSNGVILLNENYQYEYILLEYIASPQAGGEYYLPMQFREALISWIRWMDIVSVPTKTHVQNANVGMRERLYHNARRKALAKWKPTRISEAYQSSQEMSRMAVKT